MQYKVGDNAVYAGHGVGRIISIETTEMYGAKQTFYRMEVLETGMKILIPATNAEARGLRPIVAEDEIERILNICREKDVKVDSQTWNRRHREYMEKIKTGSLFEIAEVFRDLYVLKAGKELSFGEKKMLDLAKGHLVRELCLATSKDKLKSEDEVSQMFDLG